MARFFVDRPIVSMVISILMTLVGIVSMLSLAVILRVALTAFGSLAMCAH